MACKYFAIISSRTISNIILSTIHTYTIFKLPGSIKTVHIKYTLLSMKCFFFQVQRLVYFCQRQSGCSYVLESKSDSPFKKEQMKNERPLEKFFCERRTLPTLTLYTYECSTAKSRVTVVSNKKCKPPNW